MPLFRGVGLLYIEMTRESVARLRRSGGEAVGKRRRGPGRKERPIQAPLSWDESTVLSAVQGGTLTSPARNIPAKETLDLAAAAREEEEKILIPCRRCGGWGGGCCWWGRRNAAAAFLEDQLIIIALMYYCCGGVAWLLFVAPPVFCSRTANEEERRPSARA